MFDITRIKELIPHRYPLLLVDKIIEVVEGQKAIGIKNVTFNEPYFLAHSPNSPVMPGVLVVEALAQVGGIVMSSGENIPNQIGLLTGIDNCRFKKQVVPGHQLYLQFEVTRVKGQIVKGKGMATVDGELACEADIMFAFASIAKN
ncbi:3-hydroxyacyl-ACP dehydratase FabZ [Paenibacillus sp. BC26]|uniref:3-hydroxyacyl-ACP dehydratase FabZ n=1 Tax=Paenibacillus sp. BC26 TaxID=1881032 RepID=UPI0008ECF885|nr:3-hydroxyacyl-ACP dehydratase FabZ [Paenibacillus sp. BC26]SFS72564.1 3-hydroxyacyl-[acyl-carrier-protein] dehydratase [Paenibacillus sp. BC26]